MNQWGTCQCGDEDYLIGGLCEPCRAEDDPEYPNLSVLLRLERQTIRTYYSDALGMVTIPED